MLRTIEAEITSEGTVTLLEPIEIEQTTRALVRVMENGSRSKNGNVAAVLNLLKTPEFQNRRSYPADEIDKQIEEGRNAWE